MRSLRFAALLIAAFLCVAGACGGGKGKADGGAGGLGGGAGPAGNGGSGGSGGSSGSGGSTDGGLVGCIDQPGALDRPPNGRLPCELIPPGVRL
jgi:hypothetical protein